MPSPGTIPNAPYAQFDANGNLILPPLDPSVAAVGGYSKSSTGKSTGVPGNPQSATSASNDSTTTPDAITSASPDIQALPNSSGSDQQGFGDRDAYISNYLGSHGYFFKKNADGSWSYWKPRQGSAAGGQQTPKLTEQVAQILGKVNPPPATTIGTDVYGDAMKPENPLDVASMIKSSNANTMDQLKRLREQYSKDYGWKPSIVAILGNALAKGGNALTGSNQPTYLEQQQQRMQEVQLQHTQQDFALVKNAMDFQFNQQMQALNAQLQAHVITPAQYASAIGQLQQAYQNQINQYADTIRNIRSKLGGTGLTAAATGGTPLEGAFSAPTSNTGANPLQRPLQ